MSATHEPAFPFAQACSGLKDLKDLKNGPVTVDRAVFMASWHG